MYNFLVSVYKKNRTAYNYYTSPLNSVESIPLNSVESIPLNSVFIALYSIESILYKLEFGSVKERE